MTKIAFAGLAVAAIVLTGCTNGGLSVEEACTEIKEPMLAAVEDEKSAAHETAELLRDVGGRGNDQVGEVFGDAAEAINYLDENGNEGIAPNWVNVALDELASTCGPIIEG